MRPGYRSERWIENVNTGNAPNVTTADDVGVAMQNLWTDSDNTTKQEILELSRSAMSQSPDKQSSTSLGEKEVAHPK